MLAGALTFTTLAVPAAWPQARPNQPPVAVGTQARPPATHHAQARPQAPTLPPSARPPEYCPAKGTLVIVGGRATEGTGSGERFIGLAGGPERRFIVVPTTGGNRTADGAVWFDGGRKWNIVDSYANTLTLKEFHEVFERGGVIGGSSAGATIQGDYLVRGTVAGPDIMMTPEKEHEKGLRSCGAQPSTSTSTRGCGGTTRFGSSRRCGPCSASACRRARRSS
jgi:hypothetical protein